MQAEGQNAGDRLQQIVAKDSNGSDDNEILSNEENDGPNIPTPFENGDRIDSERHTRNMVRSSGVMNNINVRMDDKKKRLLNEYELQHQLQREEMQFEQ